MKLCLESNRSCVYIHIPADNLPAWSNLNHTLWYGFNFMTFDFQMFCLYKFFKLQGLFKWKYETILFILIIGLDDIAIYRYRMYTHAHM